MEAAAPPVTTGSKTMADLFGRAAETHGEHTFARHKVGDEWHDISYAQAWDTIRTCVLGVPDSRSAASMLCRSSSAARPKSPRASYTRPRV